MPTPDAISRYRGRLPERLMGFGSRISVSADDQIWMPTFVTTDGRSRGVLQGHANHYFLVRDKEDAVRAF